MTDLTARPIGELVAEDYRLAGVFKQYGIDFCCGGGRTVRAACEKKGLPVDDVVRALQAATEQGPPSDLRPDTWEVDFLADYIVNVHHRYVRENIPLLEEFTRKVARVHGAAHPELIEIAALFAEVADELSAHMEKEEAVLFPHIRSLVAARRAQAAAAAPAFGTVRNPIRVMEHEHDRAGELMRAIRSLAGDFTPPSDACNTYRVTYAKLDEFESDLHRHVHLENNILFPKAVALETDERK